MLNGPHGVSVARHVTSPIMVPEIWSNFRSLCGYGDAARSIKMLAGENWMPWAVSAGDTTARKSYDAGASMKQKFPNESVTVSTVVTARLLDTDDAEIDRPEGFHAPAMLTEPQSVYEAGTTASMRGEAAAILSFKTSNVNPALAKVSECAPEDTCESENSPFLPVRVTAEFVRVTAEFLSSVTSTSAMPSRAWFKTYVCLSYRLLIVPGSYSAWQF